MKSILFILLFSVIYFDQIQAQSNEAYTDLLKSSESFVENKANGSINWTDQYIEAKGESVVDTSRFKNPAQANAMASRGAVVVAQRNLLEIIQGVHVQGETTVKDMITESDVIKTKVDGVLKNAQIVEGPKLNSIGLMEVTMRVPIYTPTGLASAVYKPKSTEAKLPKSEVPEVEKSPGKKDKKSKKSEAIPALQDTRSSSEMVEQIIFQVTGQEFSPDMFPKIEDLDGNTLIDLMEQYNVNRNDFPKILKSNPQILDKIKNNPKATIVELIQDNNGKLIAQAKSKETLQKIKNTGLEILKIAKSVILF